MSICWLTLNPLTPEGDYHISSPISRAMFSVFGTKVWEIFPRETGFGLKPMVWDSKTSTKLMLM